MPLQVKKVQLKVKDGNQYVDGDMLFNVDAEAWARGQRNGQTITDPNDPAYNQNAYFYAQQAATSAAAADQIVFTGNLAPSYSSSAAYQIGDYVMQNDTLYECTTAIPSPGEAFNASHWREVMVSDIKEQVDNIIVVNEQAQPETKVQIETTDEDVDIALMSDLTTAVSSEQARATATENLKVNRPLINGQPSDGVDGQVLRTRGDGTTAWQAVGTPGQAQTQAAVDAWMNENAWEYVIPDNSITPNKFANLSKAVIKYSAVNGQTLNEIFSVYDTVIVDTNINITNGCDYPVKFVGNKTITFSDGLIFNSSLSIVGCNIYSQNTAVVNTGEIYLDNCDISGSIRFSQNRNIKNSIIKNCYMHDLNISTFYFIDYAFDNIIIENNVVEGFTSTLFNIGTGESEIDLTTRKLVVFRNNYIDGGNEVNAQGYYYTPLLVENDTVYVINNIIKNITDNYASGNPTYNAYLSSNIVEFIGNHIENVHSQGATYNTFMKSKNSGFKHFADNYFKDNHYISLFSCEDNSTWIVENCIFEASQFTKCSTRNKMTDSIFRNCKIISNTDMTLFMNSSGLVFESCNFIANTLGSNGGVYGDETATNSSKFKNCTFECKQVNAGVIQNRIYQNILQNCEINTYTNLLNPESKNCYIRKPVFYNSANMNHKDLTFKILVSSNLSNAVPFVLKVTSKYSNIIDFVKVTYDSQSGNYLYNGSTTHYSGEYIDFSPSQTVPYLREKAAYSGLERTIDIISL